MKATKSASVRVSPIAAADRAGRDVERRDQGSGAVPDVLELTPFDVSRLHRQARGGAFQGLDAGHLVDRNGADHLVQRSRGAV